MDVCMYAIQVIISTLAWFFYDPTTSSASPRQGTTNDKPELQTPSKRKPDQGYLCKAIRTMPSAWLSYASMCKIY